MAISFVAAGAVAQGANPTVAVPAGYQQADLLLIICTAANSASTPTGWTTLYFQGTAQFLTVFYKFATGSESSVALVLNNSAATAVMVAYRGVSATDTITSSAINSTGTTATPRTLTTTYANEYVISIYADANLASTWTANGSTTARVNSASTTSFNGLLIADELQATAGTSTARTATISTSNTWSAIALSIIPSGRYWVGSTATWDTTTKTGWAFSSGGAGGAPVPTAQDNVFFDQAATYTVTMTGALTCLDITVSAGTVTFATGTTPTLAVSGSMSLVAATVWSSTGAITFNATTTGKTVTTNGVTISAAVTFNSLSGGWTLGSAFATTGTLFVNQGAFSTSNFSVNADILTSTSGNTRSITLGSSTITLTNVSPINLTLGALTFNAGTSQINCTTGSAATFAGVGLTFYNVSFTSATATPSISGTNTFNNLSFTGRTASGINAVQFQANQTINGTLTVSAGTDATMRTFIQSNAFNTTRTLTCAAVSLTDVDFRDITIAGAAAPASGTRLGDCKGNSGITFLAGVNKYWNLATGGNWGGAIAWATAGGGTPAINNFPLAQDTAIFQSTGLNSGATVTVNANYNIGTIDMSARTANTMTLATGTTTPAIYGNWINGTGTTLTGTGAITFAGRGSQTVTSAGINFSQPITFNSPGGTLQLQDALATVSASAGAFTLTNGTLDLNGKTLTVLSSTTGTFTTGAGTKNLTFNGGTLACVGTSTTAFNNAQPSGFTTTAGTGTGTISMTGSTAKTFVGGTSTFNCNLNQGGAGALTISGSNTFLGITNTYSATGATTITFTSGTTQTVTNFTASGTSGKVLTINSTVAGTAATLSQASGTVSVDYMSIKDSTATGGATWYAGANSTNVSGNTGWIFTAPPAGVTLTGVVASGLISVLSPTSSLAASGVLASGLVGTPTPVIAPSLSGSLGSGFSGSVSPTLAPTASGVFASGYAGTMTIGPYQFALSGNQASGYAGKLSPTIAPTFTGVYGSGFAGSVTSASNVSASGVNGSGYAGSLTPTSAVLVNLNGALAQGQVGSITIGPYQFSLIGVTANGLAGAVSPINAPTFTGVFGSGFAGNVTTTSAISTSGVASSGFAGSVTSAFSIGASGVFGSGFTGTLAYSPTLSGVLATGFAGTVSPTLAPTLAGAYGAGFAGILSVAERQIALSNVLASGFTGTVTPVEGIAINAAGVDAFGYAGTLTVTAAPILAGTLASGLAGSASAAAQIPVQTVLGSGLVGTPIANPTQAIAGSFASGLLGTPTTVLNPTGSGVSGSGSAGTPTSGIAPSLFSVQASGLLGALGISKGGSAVLSSVLAQGQAGILVATPTFTLSGSQATGLAGYVVYTLQPLLVGVQATGLTGQVAVSSSAYVTGAYATGLAGTVGFERAFGISGVQAAGRAGTVLNVVSVTVNGVKVTGLVGQWGNWAPVPDDQSANWTNVANSQGPNWTGVTNAQSPGWTPISNTQTSSWSTIGNGQSPGWTEVKNS